MTETPTVKLVVTIPGPLKVLTMLIVAVPGAPAVMTGNVPSVLTVATVLSLDAPEYETTAPSMPVAVMVTACVSPALENSTVPGENRRIGRMRIGTSTVKAASPVTPPLVALIVVVPADTAVIVALPPLPLTVATSGALDCQLTVRSASVLPSPARTTAVAVVASPTSVAASASATATLPTAGGPAGPSPPQPTLIKARRASPVRLTTTSSAA